MRTLFALGLISLFLTSCAAKQYPTSFQTPEDTFFTWKQAARNMDLATLLRTYARSARPGVEEELARSTEEALKEMQREARSTDFRIEKIVYEDELAYLRVLRKKQRQSEIEVLTMVKEGDEWKLLP